MPRPLMAWRGITGPGCAQASCFVMGKRGMADVVCHEWFGLSMEKRVKGVGSMSRILLSVAFVIGVLSVSSASAASSSSDGCPNAAIRAAQHATFLSGCRAYEMVSPVVKGSADVNPENMVQTTRDGGQALFSSAIAFPGVVSSTNQSYFLGERSSDGWSTGSIEPPQYNPAKLVFYTSPATSADLTATLQMSRVALAPGAVQGRANIYLRDNRTGERRLVGTSSAEGAAAMIDSFTGAGAKPFDGGTSDFSHIVFEAVGKLTDDAVDGAFNVYDYSQAGGLRLASVLPDGTSDPAGSTAHVRNDVATRGHSAVSDDGSRIVFNGYTSNALFLRENGVTVSISTSQRAGDPDTPQPATFVSMTADGSQIFFLSKNRLTDDSTAVLDELYRYDVASGRLVDLTVASDPADSSGGFVWRVLSVSDSGDRVYFYSAANLAAGGVSGGANIYLWTPEGTRFVAALNLTEEGTSPGIWSMSPSGRFFAFTSIAPITGFDSSSPACSETATGACNEVYVYDAEAKSVACASCRAGESPIGHSTIGGQAVNGGQISNYYGRAVTDDGQVFFETPNPLVAGDTNGKVDVYEWDGAAAGLISSGQGDGNSTFADASIDGSSAFFATAQSLVGQDVDKNIDLYVARVGGGLAGQSPPPPSGGCQDDGCQAPGTPSAELPMVGSIDFSGTGNGAGPESARTLQKVRVSLPKSVVGTSARLKVKVPAGGRIRVAGPGLATSSKTATRAGSYGVVVRLSGRARQTLKRKHRLTVRVAVRFVPSAGKAQSAAVSVTFRTATTSKKKGRS